MLIRRNTGKQLRPTNVKILQEMRSLSQESYENLENSYHHFQNQQTTLNFYINLLQRSDQNWINNEISDEH